MTRTPPLFRLAVAAVALSSLAACTTFDRLAAVGDPPKMSGIENPVQQPGYRPVSMPMPTPPAPVKSANSLWRPGSRAFFKDQRASQVGDILTVTVNITDKAALDNNTVAARDNSESAGMPNMFGLEGSLSKVFAGASAASLVDLNSKHSTNGSGSLKRDETINTQFAAVITQVLPNGNLVIAGRQEIRVNAELRELSLTGVIRPEDIMSDNTISSEKIAEARIAYGGKGTISDVQQPRLGSQVLDIIMPF